MVKSGKCKSILRRGRKSKKEKKNDDKKINRERGKPVFRELRSMPKLPHVGSKIPFSETYFPFSLKGCKCHKKSLKVFNHAVITDTHRELLQICKSLNSIACRRGTPFFFFFSSLIGHLFLFNFFFNSHFLSSCFIIVAPPQNEEVGLKPGKRSQRYHYVYFGSLSEAQV